MAKGKHNTAKFLRDNDVQGTFVGQTGEWAVSTSRQTKAGGECEDERTLPGRQGQRGRGQGTAKGTGTWGLRERNGSQERNAPSMQAAGAQR